MSVGPKTYYAYIHARPDTVDASGVFYVGKGQGKRGRKFSARSDVHKAVVATFDGYPLVGTLECSTSDIAYDLERGLIKRLRAMGAPLVNKTVGGGGLEGYTMPESARRLQSLAKMGDKNPMRRPEVAARVRANTSEEAKRKRVEALRTPEVKAKRIASVRQFWERWRLENPKTPKGPRRLPVAKKSAAKMTQEERTAWRSEWFSKNNPSSRDDIKRLRSHDSKMFWARERDRMVAAIKDGWTDERRARLSENNPSHRADVNAKKSAKLKGVPQVHVTCPHCGLEGGLSAMLRYHFDNCKKKED